MTREELAQNYKRLRDERLLILAGDIGKLTTEAKEVLIGEIKTRGLKMPQTELEGSENRNDISSIDFINETVGAIFDEEHKDAIEMFYVDKKIAKIQTIVLYVLGAMLILTGFFTELPVLLGCGGLFIVLGLFKSSEGKNDLQLVFYPDEIMFVRHSDLLKSKTDYYNLSVNKRFEKIKVNRIKSIDHNSKFDSAAALEINLINKERIPINLIVGSAQKNKIIELFTKTYHTD